MAQLYTMSQNNNMFKISLTENAFHSLKRGFDLVEGWRKTNDDWNLKEAIIWVHHGIELSFKLMLTQKDEFLIFESVDNAVQELKKWRQKTGEHVTITELFKYSNIKTVGFLKALERVSAVLDIYELTSGMPLYESITILNKYRNQVVHLTITIEKNKIVELLSEIIRPFLRIVEVQVKDDIFINYFADLLPQLDEVDKIINNTICSLKHTESAFTERMKQISGYIDMQKTDFNKKQVVFREGFAETEYFAYKKLLQESARILRDFPKFDRITVVMPASREGKIFKTVIDPKKFEEFADVKISHLKSDITNWRNFLNKIDKTMVMKFANSFVREQKRSS